LRKTLSEERNMDSSHLDFGCGTTPRNPFNANKITCVDINPISSIENLVVILPGSALPFEDDSFTSVSAYDVLEHLPRFHDGRNIFIFYMNEMCRVLKPGGKAIFVFPSLPHREAFSDPTHLNYITSDTVNYFTATPGGPYYEGINSTYKVIRNKKLRRFRYWVDNAEFFPNTQPPKNLRRRLSLTKRSLQRFFQPSHRIWILQKLD
jgi:SAM-dependent methyltransferase